MKAFRLLGAFVFFVILVTFGLSFMLPTSQKVERSIVVKAPANVIYTQLIRLENFNRFSVWSQEDSSAVYTLSGTDGAVGASSSWEGSPLISGKGKITITALQPDRKVTHQLEFSKPRKGKATSVFLITETNPGETTVTWTFSMATPRPKNIFNLFYSIDKELGKDFEDGLKAMKTLIEASVAANPPE